MKDHYIGTLVGCALGDTLGMPVEGWKPEQIRRYVGRVTQPMVAIIPRDGAGNEITEDEFGKIKNYTRHFRLGEYTDDTMLTLALAESIAERGKLDLNDVGNKQLDAFVRNEGKGWGGTTKLAMAQLRNGISPTKSGVIGYPGNAPAMKMSPIGLYIHATEDYRIGLAFAKSVGKITHLDPRSVVSGVVQAHAVYAALTGISRQEFVDMLPIVGERHEEAATAECKAVDQGTLTTRLQWIRENKDANADTAYRILNNRSSVLQSYPFALFMFQRHWDDPVNGLLETVNWGGDCDTTGAMYGALAGARHGNVWPTEWVEKIQGLEPLVHAAEGIWELRKL